MTEALEGRGPEPVGEAVRDLKPHAENMDPLPTWAPGENGSFLALQGQDGTEGYGHQLSAPSPASGPWRRVGLLGS